ncbi:hypothetical protein JL721_6903 [Aureococcus anophagefferens]|nr:hypothetical protein JL721_6903 [Aureococcus anophagefferens]
MVSSEERSFVDQILHYHASGGDLDALVRVINDRSGGVRIEDAPHGYTRLFYAARNGWSSAIAWLLEQGADVHLGQSLTGQTTLQVAAIRGHYNAAVLLLDAGARLYHPNSTGWTALHFAAADNRFKMCKLLLSRGASLDARSTKGRDPEAHARFHGHPTLADFLAAVRAAGGWTAHVAARRADRAELLAFRRALPTLRRSGPCAARAQARLFLDAKVPDDVFVLVLQFWRSERDY